MRDAAHEIEHLRRHRVKAGPDVSIAKMIKATANSASRTHKRLGQLIELWERHVPAPLAAETTITGLRAGVLHITVDNSSTAYELDRLLREGLEQQLRAEYRGTLVRVRVRVAAADQ